MAKKLTKGVLQGTQYKENFQIEWNGEEFEIEIRALNNSEATEVEELTQDGINVNMKPGVNGKMNRNMSFDSRKNFRGRKHSDIKAVALGTTDDEVTVEVIEDEFPPKVVSDIGARVKQISGIGNQEEVSEFRTGEGEESGDSE